jgi:hypothetical protein
MVIGKGGKLIRKITRDLDRRFHLDNPQIDVQDVAFVSGQDSYNANTHVLTVGDGTHTAQINIIGSANFSFQSDGHSGTMITFV